MSIAAWDEKYRNPDFNDGAPVPLVVDFCKNLKPGRALDLACGAGRNTLWLLDHGWNVTAVDNSASALELLRNRAALDAHLTTQVADLERHEYAIGDNLWDLIIISYYLQRDLLEEAALGLVRGGVAIVIVHLDVPDRPPRFALRPGELIRCFPNLTVLHTHEGVPTGLDTGRSVAEIVVRND